MPGKKIPRLYQVSPCGSEYKVIRKKKLQHIQSKEYCGYIRLVLVAANTRT